MAVYSLRLWARPSLVRSSSQCVVVLCAPVSTSTLAQNQSPLTVTTSTDARWDIIHTILNKEQDFYGQCLLRVNVVFRLSFSVVCVISCNHFPPLQTFSSILFVIWGYYSQAAIICELTINEALRYQAPSKGSQQPMMLERNEQAGFRGV